MRAAAEAEMDCLHAAARSHGDEERKRRCGASGAKGSETGWECRMGERFGDAVLSKRVSEIDHFSG